MQSYLLVVGLEAGVNLALLLPFFVLAFLTTRKGRSAVRPVLLFAVLMAMDIAFIFSPGLVKFIPSWGGWNWQGKLLEAAWPLLLCLCAPTFFPARRVGLLLPEDRRRWRDLPVVCVIYAFIAIPVMLLLGAHFGVLSNAPTFAYEATMPGLGEEFVYRGVLLMLLNEAFGRPWKFAGIQFGWGFIIITAMFGFLHGVDAQSFDHIHFHWTAMIGPALDGLALAWLRERSGSVWPSVLFHNFVNTLSQFFN